jgi:hypothetical protein
MYYSDLSTEERRELRNQSGYDAKSLKTEDPYLIPDYDFEDEMVEQFKDIYGLPDSATIYLDKEHLAREWGMDYELVTINGTDYRFRSW